MPDPTTLDELNARIQANMRIEGYGLETRTVLTCPFCGAPDWMVYPITAGLNDYADLAVPHTCKACQRSAKLVTKRLDGGVSQELVQTGGPEPPAFFKPKPRRES